jgi:hemolysin activation/secretion protein
MIELKEFIGSINQWYRNNGYITARALLPPQEIKGGILKVLLIEGLTGSVKILGNRNTREDYILDRVSVPKGKLLDINRLDKKLAWFNGINDIKIRIKLQAGEKPGTTDCFMLVYEPEDKQCSLFIDTAGNKGTGETRSGIIYTDASISGRRDAFSMTALMTNSSKAVMAAYNFPINRYGTKASVYYNVNNLLIDNDSIGIHGESNLAGVSLSHPLTVRPRFRSEVICDVQQQESKNRISGVNFVDDNEERFSLGCSLLRRSASQALYLKPMVSLCDYNGLGEAKKVRKYLLDGVWQKIKSGNQQIDLKIAGQKTTDDYLPSSDQFFLGGLYSVRGYDESIISGDSGLNLKLDYSLPLKAVERTRGFIFCDWGRIYGKSFSGTKMIYSCGFGLMHSFAKDSMIVLSVGYPMVKHINSADIDPHKIELTMNISF